MTEMTLLSIILTGSMRRPVIAFDAILGVGFNIGGGREIIFAEYRTESHTPITSKNLARSQAPRRFDALFKLKRINCDKI